MTDAPAKTRSPNWVWFLLNFPFGATNGFITVALGYTATQSKTLSQEAVGGFVAALVAASLLPHTWKFFWAPVADVTLTRKRWYQLGNLVSSFTIASLGFITLDEDHLALLSAICIVNSVFVSLLGMAVEGLMAHTTPPDELGRAAGWFQAGNLGGNGLGGGLALLVAEHFSGAAASIATGALLLLCSLGLLFVAEPIEQRASNVVEAVKHVAKDVWSIIGRRTGIVALALCLLPLCAGAGANLFSTMGEAWGADAELIALTQGLLGGLVAAVGCLAGGMLSDRMTRRNAYLVAGVILATVAAGMAVGPRTPVFYAAFVLLYNFASGVAYGAFTGFVLAVIGKGAAATKYNALAALSNIPILYMTLIIGNTADASGWTDALWVDALSGLGGVILLYGIAWIFKVGGRDGETVALHPEVAASDGRRAG